MSGWIKLEKDLRDDVRVRRMAIELQKTPYCNGTGLQPVTLVLGCLVQLWMHADSFAREDDTLDITLDEIDQLVGVKGFAKALPPDWLEILDEHTVKLPGFQGHNGTEAKRRVQATKRVQEHRKRNSVTAHKKGVTQERYQTRPDQTREDQTIQEQSAAAPLKVVEFAGLDSKTWDRWAAYRTEIRKPLKPASIPAAQKALAAFGSDQAAVVEQSIAQGWTGLFRLNGQAAKPKYVPAPTTAELEAREIASAGH